MPNNLVDVDVCFYHADCVDGAVAAYTVMKYAQIVLHKTIPIYPVKYGQMLDNSLIRRDKHVIVVDFCFPTREMCDYAYYHVKSFTVLDHHESAYKTYCKDYGHVGPIQDLKFTTDNLTQFYELVASQQETTSAARVPLVYFDLKKSGASLAHAFFFGESEPSRLVKYAEDRDLWKNALFCHEEISEYVKSIDFTYDNYAKLETLLEYDFSTAEALGTTLLKKRKKDVDYICNTAIRVNFEGHDIWFANCPRWIDSDVGNVLAAREPTKFSLTYREENGEDIHSLRSINPTGMNVYELAQKFGGGGHKHAAGFRTVRKRSQFW